MTNEFQMKIIVVVFRDIPELASNQEEADIRMLLHIQHEGAQSHDLK